MLVKLFAGSEELRTYLFLVVRGSQSEDVVELFAKAKKAKIDPQTVAKAFDKYMAEDGPLSNVKVKIAGKIE